MINSTKAFAEELYNGNRKYQCLCNCTLSDGTKLTFDNSELMSLEITDATSSSGFEIGSAIAKTLKIKLQNYDDKYSEYDFYGASLYVYVGLMIDGTIQYLNKGHYTVDDPAAYGSQITLTMIDDMYLLSDDWSTSLTYPTSLFQIVSECCSKCGVVLSGHFDNDTLTVSKPEDTSNMTYREVISYCAQISGNYARINVNNTLELKWYKDFEDCYDGGTFSTNTKPYSDGASLDGGNFTNYNSGSSADGGIYSWNYTVLSGNSANSIGTDDIVITGIAVEVDSESFTAGTEGYILGISSNPFITDKNAESICSRLYQRIGGMKFRKFSVDTPSDPRREAGDLAVVIDRKGNEYYSIITGITFSYGKNDKVSNDAEDVIEKSSKQYSESTKALISARKYSKKAYDEAVKYADEESVKLNKNIKDVSNTIGDLSEIVGDTVTDGIITESELAKASSAFDNVSSSFIEMSEQYENIESNPCLPDAQRADITTAYTNVGNAFYAAQTAYVNVTNSETPGELNANYTKFNIAIGTYSTNVKTYNGVAIIAINLIASAMADNKISNYDVAVRNMNELALNSMGYYETFEEDPNTSSRISYMHDQPTLEGSTKVWKRTENGYFWTSNYTGSSTVWTSGISADGNAVMNVLSAIGINCDWLNAGTIKGRAIQGGIITGTNINNGNGSFSVDSSGNVTANRLNSNNANITGGSLNISASSNYDNRVRLSYGSASSNIAPYEIRCVQTGNSHSYMASGGFFAYDDRDASQFSWLNTGGVVTQGGISGAWLSISGTKKRIADTENYDRRSLYCDEMSSPVFSDMGEGETDEYGTCDVYIDDIFAETIDTDCSYQVFLQPYGEGSTYVIDRTTTHFTVKGTANMKFGWELKAIQKGFDSLRLEEYEQQNPSNEVEPIQEVSVYLDDTLGYSLDDLLTDFEESEE